MTFIIIAIAAFLLIVLERVPQLQFRPSKLFRRYFLSDIFYLLTGFIAGSYLAIDYITTGSSLLRSYFGFSSLESLSCPSWLAVIIALIAIDLGNYLSHYLLHKFDLLWNFHKVHHSIPMLDWLATFRSHLVEQTLRRLIAPILLILMGMPVKVVAISGGIVTAWGMFNHSNIELNLHFLELIFITPRLHRLHHQFTTSEKNLGTIFTFWDILRGTFSREEVDKDAIFGNGEPNYPQGWLNQFVEPLKQQFNKPQNTLAEER